MKIGVLSRSESENLHYEPLFAALGAHFSIEHTVVPAISPGFDAWIAIGPEQSDVETLVRSGIPSFSTMVERRTIAVRADSTITFGNDSVTDAALVSKTMDPDRSVAYKQLPRWLKRDRTIARLDEHEIWVLRSDGRAEHHFIGVDLPIISRDAYMLDYLNGDHFMSLLPIWMFLVRLTTRDVWIDPHPRACVIIDDPNLRRPTYGMMDFAETALKARNERFHVSIATIPIDSRLVGDRVASIFALNRDVLSLMVHGNEHTRWEFGTDESVAAMTRKGREALSRISVLEQKTGLLVEKVMVPPHGKFSRNAAQGLCGAGFAGVCVPRGAFRRLDSPHDASLGMRALEVINNIPLIGRAPLAPNFRNSAIIARFLRQPIVFGGHHQDLRDNLQLLSEVAIEVNAMYDARWCSIGDVFARTYLAHVVGSTARVGVHSRSTRIEIPDGITELQLDLPLDNSGLPVHARYMLTGARGEIPHQYRGELIAVRPGQVVRVESEIHRELLVTQGARVIPRLIPWVRRRLSEARDRLYHRQSVSSLEGLAP